MLQEKQEREAKQAALFEERQKSGQQQQSSLPSLFPQAQKQSTFSIFDDMDIQEDDNAEVIEEKNQKKALKNTKNDLLIYRQDLRQQELALFSKKKEMEKGSLDEEAAKK